MYPLKNTDILLVNTIQKVVFNLSETRQESFLPFFYRLPPHRGADAVDSLRSGAYNRPRPRPRRWTRVAGHELPVGTPHPYIAGVNLRPHRSYSLITAVEVK
ncbi:hypothetical protein BN903_27 [Halorubrum sp. AJ67]|nr:hypothetical protein BN903_27 [Halorubrum sp. AJ67]